MRFYVCVRLYVYASLREDLERMHDERISTWHQTGLPIGPAAATCSSPEIKGYLKIVQKIIISIKKRKKQNMNCFEMEMEKQVKVDSCLMEEMQRMLPTHEGQKDDDHKLSLPLLLLRRKSTYSPKIMCKNMLCWCKKGVGTSKTMLFCFPIKGIGQYKQLILCRSFQFVLIIVVSLMVKFWSFMHGRCPSTATCQNENENLALLLATGMLDPGIRVDHLDAQAWDHDGRVFSISIAHHDLLQMSLQDSSSSPALSLQVALSNAASSPALS